MEAEVAARLVEKAPNGELVTSDITGDIDPDVIPSTMDKRCDENVDIRNVCDSNGNDENIVDDDSSEDNTISCSDNGSIPDLNTLVEDDVKSSPDTSVPIICVHSAVGEQHYPADDEQGQGDRENTNHNENVDKKTDVAVNDEKQKDHDSQAQCIDNKGAESASKQEHPADGKDTEQTSCEAQAIEISKDSDKPSENDASNPKSKFSFFRSIQNIIIVSKWTKLRHGSPKSSKGQGQGNNLQVEDRSHKSDRQRKISQKSLPGDMRKKSREDECSSDCHDDDQNQFKSQEFNREGLEYVDSPSGGHSKEKSHSKGHFSFFKRHNVETPPSSPPLPPPEDLTEEQKTLLRASWDEIRGNIGQVGVIAFIGLFETHPDVKDSFVQFRGMSLESVFNSISLKEHALRVMTTVEKFINRIDRPDKLKTILEDLGRRHVTYQFNKDYINAVGMQFVCAMRPHVSKWTPETEQAWKALIDVMTYNMERGTHLEPETEQPEQQSSC